METALQRLFSSADAVENKLVVQFRQRGICSVRPKRQRGKCLVLEGVEPAVANSLEKAT